MENVFENLINGNLRDAQRLAKRYSGEALTHYAFHTLGMSTHRATLASLYLKGKTTFQRYADAN
jgi:hypothetical protein